MVDIKSLNDVYPAIKELINIFKKDKSFIKMALILEHRMFKVSWTSSFELYEEIKKVLKNFLTSSKINNDEKIINQIKLIIQVIDKNM